MIINFNTTYRDFKSKFREGEYNHVKIYSGNDCPSVIEILRGELFNLMFTNSKPDKNSNENQLAIADILKKLKHQAVVSYVPKYDLASYNSILQFIDINSTVNNVFLNTKEFNSSNGFYDRSSNTRVWGVEHKDGKSKVCYVYSLIIKSPGGEKWNHNVTILSDSYFEALDIFLDFINTL